MTLSGIKFEDVSEAYDAGNDELIDCISLRFGYDGSDQYSELLASGAFSEFTSEKIFEDNHKGILA